MSEVEVIERALGTYGYVKSQYSEGDWDAFWADVAKDPEVLDEQDWGWWEEIADVKDFQPVQVPDIAEPVTNVFISDDTEWGSDNKSLLIFAIGGRFYAKQGRYFSHDGQYWEGDFTEVFPKQVEVTMWELKK